MKPNINKLTGSLSKLSQAASAKKDSVSGTIVLISPNDCIEVTNPRKKFDQELIESYTEQFLDPDEGQHEPINVYPIDANGKYRIHQGATRVRAGKNVLLQKPDFKLKAFIDHSLVNKSDFQRYYEQGANNIMRDNMTILDRAYYFADLIELAKTEGIKITQAELAKRFGWKDSSVISRHLKLCKMSPEVLAIYESGKTDDLESLTMLISIQEKKPELFYEIMALPFIDRATIRRANSTGTIEKIVSSVITGEEPQNENDKFKHDEISKHVVSEKIEEVNDDSVVTIPYVDYIFKTGRVNILVKTVSEGYQVAPETFFEHGINEEGTFSDSAIWKTEDEAIAHGKVQIREWAELIISDRDSVSLEEYQDLAGYLQWLEQDETNSGSSTKSLVTSTRKTKSGQLNAVVFVDVNGEEGILLLKVPKSYIGTDGHNVNTNGFVYVQIGSEIQVVKEGEYVIKSVTYRE